ncbi:hypothetical protein JCM1393_13240 [Clostridium carnis]
MDKQILQEFNKFYFNKKQISRRIYDKCDLEKIWEMIQKERNADSYKINLENNEKIKYWYNITKDMLNNIYIIDENVKSEVMGYIPGKNIEKIKLNTYKDEVFNNINFELEKDKEIFNEEKIVENIKSRLFEVFENGNEINKSLILSVYNDIGEYVGKDNLNYNKEYLEQLIDFICNFNCNKIIKAAIIQKYILDNNLFEFINGFMARTLSYIYLINNGYEVLRYCSPMKIITEQSKKYFNAIENISDNEGDLTYFIKYYIEVIKLSIEELNIEINIKYGKKILKSLIEKNNIELEDRQLKFINSIIVIKDKKITIEDYKKRTKVAYETARTDLNYLVTLGFFKISKQGKKYEYYVNDIATLIEVFHE